MTREEAVEIVIANSGKYVCGRDMAETLVKTWADVGMLKLEEPKSAEHRAYCLLDEEGHKAAQILELLKGDGLKIVEKQ